MRRALAALALLLLLAVPAASGCHGSALTTNTPGAAQVQDVRATAVRVADEVKRAVEVARVIRTAAQNLTAPKGPVPVAAMDTIDHETIKYGGVLKQALTALDTVTSEPGLTATATGIMDATAAYLKAIPATAELAWLLEVLRSTFVVTMSMRGAA